MSEAAMTAQTSGSNTPSSSLGLPRIESRRKLTGKEREDFAKKVVAAYLTPGRRVTITEICALTNRSYGAIHSLLSEAGATKRGPRTAGMEERVSS